MKKASVVLVLLLTILLMVGCAPKGNPKDILDAYLQHMMDSNFDAAYESLAEANKKSFTKDEFVEWGKLTNETVEFKEYKTSQVKEEKNVTLEGNQYKNVVEFSITEKDLSHYSGKEETETYTRYVVNDNGEWKVYRDGENINYRMSDLYDRIGWMYVEGKGKDKDLNKAAMSFKKAIEYDKTYTLAYYDLAYVYSDLGRYDEAMENLNVFINMAETDEEKSDGYNIMGTIYMDNYQYEDAIEAFNKALDLNPNNEYAKTNLKRLI